MRILERLKSAHWHVRAAFTPSDTAWKGASIGIRVLGLLTLAGLLFAQVLPHFTFHKLAGFAAVTLALIVAGAMGWLLFRLIAMLSPQYRTALFLFAPLIVLLFILAGGLGSAVTLAVMLLLIASLIGAAVAVLGKEGFQPKQQKVTISALLVGVALLATGTYVIFSSGESTNPTLDEYTLEDRTLDLPNPGLPGDYNVLTLTYGAGNDRHRPEFGAEVDLVSRTVDGSKLIDNWDGGGGWLRTNYWGFDETELPLQARVWYPDGDGPFPLVLVVHGNHDMEDYSDPGYAYLGELLASRGIMLASVDENFLNSSLSDVVDLYETPGLDEENDARGWLLLEHLVLWRDWNNDPEHSFHNRVDMDRVALIGHSRGGEAIAVAAAFNQLGRYPDDATLEFNYDFDLRGVIAIAPADGQYKPRARGTPLNNVNYFTIHGSQDGDVQSFMGTSQYSRVEVSKSDEDHRFKSSLYVFGANHGQFNTSWGRIDVPAFWRWTLDTDSIMDPQDQRNIARVYFSAFLEIVLRDRFEYLPIFTDARYAASWLPDTYYINQYADSLQRVIADFEEDIDPVTTTVANGRISGENLTKWRESYVKLKWRPLDTHVATVAWDQKVYPALGRLEITLPDGWRGADIDSVLTFSLSEANTGTTPEGWEADDQEEDEPQPLDWTIVLVDENGVRASLPLSHDQALYPQIQAVTRRASFLDDTDPAEVLLRRYAFAMRDFVNQNPAFKPSTLTRICFVFDHSEKGAIVLDDIAMATMRLAPAS